MLSRKCTYKTTAKYNVENIFAIHEFISDGMAVIEDDKGHLHSVKIDQLKLIPPTILIEQQQKNNNIIHPRM